MPTKKNPLNLNALQLKTLTLFQALARSSDHGSPAEGGGIMLGDLPHPHGDHFHVGHAVAMTKDASGLGNQAVWVALERKGLVRDAVFPAYLTLTEDGIAYDTGLASSILHGSDH